jgi:hypothetical protein
MIPQQQQVLPPPPPQQRLANEQLSESDLFYIHESFLRNFMQLRQKEAAAAMRKASQLTPTTLLMMPSAKDRIFQELLPYSALNPLLHNDYASKYQGVNSNNTKHGKECSSSCRFFIPDLCPSAFVCIQTGNLHYCTSSSCRYIVTTNFERSCTLTGLTYDLEEPSIGPSHYSNFNPSERVKIAPSVPRKRKAVGSSHGKKKPKRIIIMDLKQQPAPPLPPPSAPNRHLIMERERQNIETQVLDLLAVSQNIKKSGLAPVIAEEVRRFALEALSFWQKAIQTRYYQDVKNKFKLRIFTVVFLYASMKGIQVGGGGTKILGRFKELYHALPPSRKLKDIAKAQKFRCSQFTDNSRYLNEIIREMKMTCRT